MDNKHQRIAKLEREIEELTMARRNPAMTDADRIGLYYERKELRQKLEHLNGEEVSR